MKYIEALSIDEKLTLAELMKHHTHTRARTRAHAILLSDRHFSMNEIARIYETDRDTVSRWFINWENYGLIGLYDDVRSGRPPKLTASEAEKVKLLIEEEKPRSMKMIALAIVELFHKILSLSTLRRLAKRINYCYKRIKKSLKSKRQPEAFLQAKNDIDELRASQQANIIDLYFFDESGYTLQPVVPYAWQPKGQTVEILPSRSSRLNVLGFMSVTQAFDSFVFSGNVDTEVVIACFNAFSEKLNKTTWVVLDNATHHTSGKFKAQIPKWEKQGLFLYYLPAYSPELNLIEILWRFIKYAWLPFSAYKDFLTLQTILEDILKNVGNKYHITFA